jgi:hypothetical protein
LFYDHFLPFSYFPQLASANIPLFQRGSKFPSPFE